MASAGIEVSRISKRFGALTALADVTFDVEAGTTTALLGPNGAGKTTLLKIVAGLSKPSSGEVSVGDTDDSSLESIRSQFGVVSHQTMLYDDLTAQENLVFYGKLYGLDDAEHVARASLEVVGLSDRGDDRVRTFSRGMKQRLAIARATIHDPGFLLFDEPFTGLDVAGCDILTDRIRYFQGQNRTAIIVTHDLHQAVGLADRFVMIAKGRVIESGSCDEVSVEGLEEKYRELRER